MTKTNWVYEPQGTYVYVLRGPRNICKVGSTKEPATRIRRHRWEHQVPLELICLICHPRAAELEKQLHYHFVKLGRKEIGIEWFQLTDEDVKWLRDHSTEEVDCCDGKYRACG